MPEQLFDPSDQPSSNIKPEQLTDLDTSKVDIYQFAEQIGIADLDTTARVELIKHTGVGDFIATMTMVHQINF